MLIVCMLVAPSRYSPRCKPGAESRRQDKELEQLIARDLRRPPTPF